MDYLTLLEKARLQFRPLLPQLIENDFSFLKPAIVENWISKQPAKDEEMTAKLFPETFGHCSITFKTEIGLTHSPLRVGVVFSGGQAPGGHNVITGLYDALKKLNSESQLFGFLDGPQGIINNNYRKLTDEVLAPYRNMGGFDLIGSGRTKIETPDQFQAVEATALALKLDGLVIIGGDDSNTTAALLAEHFKDRMLPSTVVGVPKTIDGDLKNESIEVSFGFDTACKIYAETIGNILKDCLSAKKYYFFIKLMGRSASHIALECALQTSPNLTLIGEEIAAKQKTLKDITKEIADLITKRSAVNKNYGVILIPEGIIEFIPEIKAMIKEINTLLSSGDEHASTLETLSLANEKVQYIHRLLSESSKQALNSLPDEIQGQLLLDRDSHGNVQVSKIDTERLLITTVKAELIKRKKEGTYKGKFDPQPVFCGYEGRSSLPSNFDAQYCYSLGHVAALLVEAKATGYLACIKELTKPVEEWTLFGIPITTLLTMEERHGKFKPVIKKALVNLDDKPFQNFAQKRMKWELEDCYRCPGPIQFFGPRDIADGITITMQLEQEK